MIWKLFRKKKERPAGWPPFVFDHKGRRYYGWNDYADLPPERASEVDDIVLQIDAGLSRAQLSTLADFICAEILASMEARDNKAKAKHLARANLIAQELKVRPKQIIPRECYYALAAVCIIRDDEDPLKFDPVVQAEKMQTFRQLAEAGHTPFTTAGAFNKLCTGIVSFGPDYTFQSALDPKIER